MEKQAAKVQTGQEKPPLGFAPLPITTTVGTELPTHMSGMTCSDYIQTVGGREDPEVLVSQ